MAYKERKMSRTGHFLRFFTLVECVDEVYDGEADCTLLGRVEKANNLKARLGNKTRLNSGEMTDFYCKRKVAVKLLASDFCSSLIFTYGHL